MTAGDGAGGAGGTTKDADKSIALLIQSCFTLLQIFVKFLGMSTVGRWIV